MDNKKSQLSPIELLTPARDLECGRAALRCGADAVYIGANRFSAREQAGNPLEDIAALADEAHLYRARVYAALNTILTDEELPQAVTLAHQLYEAGIDGLIIQDTGLLESRLPPVPLIASTQMHNHTPERVAFLEQVGFRRVILARELSLDEIRAIRKAAPSIELEVFVHGALCVSMSGQCWMSFAIGGRSANRGACAQPCRRPYDLRDENGRSLGPRQHWLSLHDMDRTAYLADLLDAGVTSFKIEGRLKDRDYVMNTTLHYRLALDPLLESRGKSRASSGILQNAFEPDPARTFNRGFTPYFMEGRTARIGRPQTPTFIGEPVGIVTAVHGGRFECDTPSPLLAGDGIAFFDTDGILRGTVINRVAGRSVWPRATDHLAPGIEIRRNRDHAFLTMLAGTRIERRLRVRMVFDLADGQPCLTMTDEDGCTASQTLDIAAPPADKPDRGRTTIASQLGSLGTTPFVLDHLDIAEPVPFVKVADLNRLRRETVDLLLAARAETRPDTTVRFTPNSVPFPASVLTYPANVMNRGAEAFYRRHGVQHITPAAEQGLDMAGRMVMRCRYCLRCECGQCAGGPRPHQHPPEWTLVDADGRRFSLVFDCAACMMEVMAGVSDT